MKSTNRHCTLSELRTTSRPLIALLALTLLSVITIADAPIRSSAGARHVIRLPVHEGGESVSY